MWLSLLAAVFVQGEGDGQPAPAKPSKGGSEAAAQEAERQAKVPQDVLFLEKTRIRHEDGRVTAVFQVGHDPKHDIKKILEKFKSKKGWVHQSEEHHLLIITDQEKNVNLMEQILRAALSPPPQVKIEVQVIEVRWTKDQQIGLFGDLSGDFAIWQKAVPPEGFLREIRFNFTSTAATGTSPFIGSSFKFESSSKTTGSFGGVLQAFLERGRAEIKSSPTIWVRSGQSAKIHSGERVPVPHSQIHPGGVNTTVRFEDTGVTLEVEPHVVSSNLVSLKVNPSVKAALGREVIASGAGGTIVAPSFTTRSLDTQLIARTGETILIGGLVRKETITARRGIPLLMDIPLLGYLFSRTETQELLTEIIFLLRPTVYATIREAPHGMIDPARGGK